MAATWLLYLVRLIRHNACAGRVFDEASDGTCPRLNQTLRAPQWQSRDEQGVVEEAGKAEWAL
jgi:hypothetical protein